MGKRRGRTSHIVERERVFRLHQDASTPDAPVSSWCPDDVPRAHLPGRGGAGMEYARGVPACRTVPGVSLGAAREVCEGEACAAPKTPPGPFRAQTLTETDLDL